MGYALMKFLFAIGLPGVIFLFVCAVVYHMLKGE